MEVSAICQEGGMGFSCLLRGEVSQGQAARGAVTGEMGYSFGVPLQKPPTLASGGVTV